MQNNKTDIVYNYLLSYIDEQRFSETHKIPSETVLSKKLSVSRDTVRSALQRLKEENFIYKVRGSGTYINKVRASSFQREQGKAVYKVGLILQGQDKKANSVLLKGVEQIFEAQEVDLHILFTDNKVSNERRCLDTVIYQNYDGFIIDGVKASLFNPNIECYQKFYERKIPIVFYNNYYKELNYPKVINNDIHSADCLVKALADAGHRRICAFFVFDNFQSVEKFQGYVKALRKYNIPFDDDDVKWFFSNDVKEENFPKKLVSFLKRVPDCTAIVCCNQLICNALMKALKHMNSSIPEDYSVVCFDYLEQDLEQMPITCSVNRGFDIGQIAGRRLMKMIKEKEYCGHHYSYMLEPVIHEGQSIRILREDHCK